jgi:hypothetical protein
MIKYKQLYIKAFGFDEGDFIPSEISGTASVDIHHIVGRGKCGEDRIENLMALTREEHTIYGDKKVYMGILLRIHRHNLYKEGVRFDNKFFEELISQYGN